MKNKSLLLLIILYFLVIKLTFAQEGHGGFPITYFEKYRTLFTGNSFDKIENISNYNLPGIDNKREAERADSIKKNCSSCEQKSYYGTGVDIDIDIKSEATLKILEDGSKVWLYKINSSNAYALQFYFGEFKLPEGAKLFFYNEDKSMFLGSFTKENNPKNQNQKIPFGTQYISGKTIFIEYFEPSIVEFDARLRIIKVIHVFKDVFHKESGPYGSSLPCEINVSCALGAGWADEISSVALILYYDANSKLTAQCSGAVINNTAQNGEPLFLTANHCIDGNGSPYNSDTWVFLFNHEDPNCNGSTVSGSLTESVYGSLVLTSDAPGSPTTDYCLLRLNTSVQTLKAYGVCYAGWDKIESHASSSPFTLGVHHPMGDVKKISKSIISPSSTCSNYYWQANWNQGLTEPGSSGSPLFNQYHHIIGQLYGQCSNPQSRDCVNPQHSDYGKFSASWTISGSGGLAFYLDPYNTGATSVNTYCPANVNTCNNGIWDISNGESGTDCGGPCPTCTGSTSGNGTSNCHNGIQDGGEAGIDCGGTSSCPPCTTPNLGLGPALPVSADDGACNAHYENFSDLHCPVNVTDFDITNVNSFTRAFISQPQCVTGEWNAAHGGPALTPGYDNAGIYIWGYGYDYYQQGIHFIDQIGSDIFFTSADPFMTNRRYTVSFYAKAVLHNNTIYNGVLNVRLAKGLVPNTDTVDFSGQDIRFAGPGAVANQNIGSYFNAFNETWRYYKFTFTPSNNNYNQIIIYPTQWVPPSPSTARIFLDKLAICAECISQQSDVSYNNVIPPATTYARNITAQNITISSSQQVKFVADNEIILNNNFVANSGSDFVGRIKGCAFNSGKTSSPDSIRLVSEVDPTDITPKEIFSYSSYKPGKNKSKEHLFDIPSQNNISYQNNYQENFKEPELKNSKNANPFIIHPNPTTGFFQLEINAEQLTKSALPVFNITVTNVLGKVAYTTIDQSFSSSIKIDLSSQPKGIYFVKVQSADKIYTEKIVLQ